MSETVLYHDTCHHALYRLTCEEFDALWERGQGRCEVCGVGEADTKRGRLSIDHDQRSLHLVRGLLCDRCNAGTLRRFDEGRPEFATEAAIRYVSAPWVPFGTPVPPVVAIKTTRAYATGPKPSGSSTKINAIRIGGIWDEAQAVAGGQGDNVPDILRLALRAYVADPTATLVALAQIRGGGR